MNYNENNQNHIAEIYQGADGYWKFKKGDAIIGLVNLKNDAIINENQDLETLITITAIIAIVALAAFKFRNKIFKKRK